MKQTVKESIAFLLCVCLLCWAAFAGAEEELLTAEELLARMEAAAEAGDLETAFDLEHQAFLLNDDEVYRRVSELIDLARSNLMDQIDRKQAEWPTGMQVMDRIMGMEPPADFAFGEAAAVENAISFSVPADWERLQTEDSAADEYAFLFRGSDPEGNEVFFTGILLENTLGSVQDVLAALEAMEEKGIPVVLNGMELILAGPTNLAGGMYLTDDGRVLGFGFTYEDPRIPYSAAGPDSKGFTDIFTSEKLMGDMAAILHSFRKP